MWISRRTQRRLQLLVVGAVVCVWLRLELPGQGPAPRAVHDVGLSLPSAPLPARGRAAEGPPIDMAMRYCAYSSIPDRYGADMFKQAKTNPEIMKMFADKGCRGGAYGGQYMIDAFERHSFATVRQGRAVPQDNWTVLWTQNSQSIYLGLERPDITAELRSGRRIHNHCTLILYAGAKRKRGVFLRHLHIKTIIYKDRLRTDIGKTQSQDRFSQATSAPSHATWSGCASSRQSPRGARAARPGCSAPT